MSSQHKVGVIPKKRRAAVPAVLFRALTLLLSPIIYCWESINGQEKRSKLLKDVRNEMIWTINNLHPQIVSSRDRRLAQGRYATVTLKCPSYLIWITGEFYEGGYDFWADVGSQMHPDSRIRIDTFAKQIYNSPNSNGRGSHLAIPATLSELDSLIHDLDPELIARFSGGSADGPVPHQLK
jgi:hypothetical protein